jgi:dihydrofolate reductase
MISLIWAMDKNNLIGKGNELPWRYSEDLKYFKKTTLHKQVLMGDKTFESILFYLKKPFPNRKSIVASLEEFSYDGVDWVKDLDDYLSQYEGDELFVAGGSTIYNLALPYADRLYVTIINKEHEGDVYFPTVDFDQFNLVSETKGDNPDLTFYVYERK